MSDWGSKSFRLKPAQRTAAAAAVGGRSGPRSAVFGKPSPAALGEGGYRGSVRALWAAAADRLARCGVPEPRLAAELLLADVLACPRLELPLRARETLTPEQARRFDEGLRRAAAGEPIAYVVGTVNFMGCTLRADRRALIPRPETEVLVSCVLACEALWRRPAPQIADVGTGSGCIAIALARERPQAILLGRDISDAALSLARENAGRAGVADRVRWQQGDLLENIAPGSLDAIVANLPYIPTGALRDLPVGVREFEPREALDGGSDGLEWISRLVADAPRALKWEGWLFVECAPDQAARVKGWFEAHGFAGTAVRRDLAGRDRVVLGARG